MTATAAIDFAVPERSSIVESLRLHRGRTLPLARQGPPDSPDSNLRQVISHTVPVQLGRVKDRYSHFRSWRTLVNTAPSGRSYFAMITSHRPALYDQLIRCQVTSRLIVTYFRDRRFTGVTWVQQSVSHFAFLDPGVRVGRVLPIRRHERLRRPLSAGNLRLPTPIGWGPRADSLVQSSHLSGRPDRRRGRRPERRPLMRGSNPEATTPHE